MVLGAPDHFTIHLNKLPCKQPVLSYLEPYTKDIFKKETPIDSVHWVCSYPWKVWNTIASGSTRVMQVRKNFFITLYWVLPISYGSIVHTSRIVFEEHLCTRGLGLKTYLVLILLKYLYVDLWNLTFWDQSAPVEIPSLCVHIYVSFHILNYLTEDSGLIEGLSIRSKNLASSKRRHAILVNIYFLPNKLSGSLKARFLTNNQLYSNETTVLY